MLRDFVDTMGLSGPPCTVLVVEDHVPLLIRLSEFVAEMGHPVISLLGVASIEEHLASGPGSDRGQTVSFDLRAVEAAFLDHYFLSRHHNGRTLTLALRAVGDAKIAGMSSSEEANRAMVDAGANLSVRKAELMRALGV
ncbi:MAG: hypothetical protein ACO1SV_07175 [Fimbriimonas sp.]